MHTKEIMKDLQHRHWEIYSVKAAIAVNIVTEIEVKHISKGVSVT